MSRTIENLMRQMILAQHRHDRVAFNTTRARLLAVLATIRTQDEMDASIEASRVINHIR